MSPRVFSISIVIGFLVLLALVGIQPFVRDNSPQSPTDADRMLACLESLANGDTSITVQLAAKVCEPYESGWVNTDTIAFHGVSIRGRDICDYVLTLSGRYRPWLPRPCPPHRLAYLQHWLPVTEYSTDWYWIQRKRAELQARARVSWRWS